MCEREARERDARIGNEYSDTAQILYEVEMVDEARAIVSGKADTAPTVEHLRVLLDWMDGRQ